MDIAVALALLTPASGDQQCVVDRDPEPDERDDVLDQRRHREHVGQGIDREERRWYRDRCGQQRHERQQRAEHDCEHHQGADPGKQGFDQHAVAGALTAV